MIHAAIYLVRVCYDCFVKSQTGGGGDSDMTIAWPTVS